MVNIKTDATYHTSREFRTDRVPAQEIKAGDMVYFEHDFCEVQMTQHFVTQRTEGANGDTYSLPDDKDRAVRVRLIYEDENRMYGPGGRHRISEHKVGDKVVVLHDTSEEAKMWMATHEQYEALKREFNLVLDNADVLADSIDDVEDDGEAGLKALKAIQEFLRIRRDEPTKW